MACTIKNHRSKNPFGVVALNVASSLLGAAVLSYDPRARDVWLQHPISSRPLFYQPEVADHLPPASNGRPVISPLVFHISRSHEPLKSLSGTPLLAAMHMSTSIIRHDKTIPSLEYWGSLGRMRILGVSVLVTRTTGLGDDTL